MRHSACQLLEHDNVIFLQALRLIEDGGRGRVSVFLDERDIEVGQSIADSVRTNIEKCDEFLVLFSRYSKDRPWVLAEMGAAWGLQKPIIVIIDKVGPKEMPDIVSPYRAVDLNERGHTFKAATSRQGVCKPLERRSGLCAKIRQSAFAAGERPSVYHGGSQRWREMGDQAQT